MSNENALILIDFINDIVHEDGKLSKMGYYDFIVRNNTQQVLADVLKTAREKEWLICHVRVGFSAGYVDHPAESPLLGGAKKFEALLNGEWGTEFNEIALPQNDEVIIQKTRVSAFYNTSLDTVLRADNVKNLHIAGVATDIAVESASRDAHDRDYNVFVIQDACVAANDEDHKTALATISKFAKVSGIA